MRRVLEAILLAGLFLLMLSALVVTPEDALPPPPAPPLSSMQAVFLPAPPPMAQAPQAAQGGASAAVQNLQALLVCLLAGGLILPGLRDSNGRILRHARYERCVYQVFRPEVAGG